MSYADLLVDVSDTLDRDDVESRFPRWVKRVEERLNTLLSDPDMEVSITISASGSSLPADFGEIVSIGTADGNPLTRMGDQEHAALRPQSGTPRFYVIQEGKIYFFPGSAVAFIVYRRSVPPLTAANDSNWLLERASRLYFYGILLEANAWDANTEVAVLWKEMWDEAIGEMIKDGVRRKWGAGPISPRIRRS